MVILCDKNCLTLDKIHQMMYFKVKFSIEEVNEWKT